LGKDLRQGERTLGALGLDKLSVEEMRQMLLQGKSA